jgi:uncharacterized RDD family membrane protein YckC
MSISLMRKLSFLFALLCVTGVFTHAIAATSHKSPAAVPLASAVPAAAGDDSAPAGAAPPVEADKNSDFDDDQDSDSRHDRNSNTRHSRYWRRHRVDRDGDMVNVGHDSFVAAGEKADGVVAIFGSSTNEGEANTVVSVLGNTRVTGPVRDSAVSVLGNTYVDSKVDESVVAVLGNVTLGPHAEVGGDVVAVFGTVNRDPSSIVHGGIQNVFSLNLGGDGSNWLTTWIKHCLFYLRPLAFVPGLGWAWTLALTCLAFYAFLAVLFRSGIEQCVHTLETQPGRAALAGLLGMLLTPVLLVLLCITVIGIAAVPFVVIALFCASLFGKAVMLCWVGGRVTGRRPGTVNHPAVAVLLGGLIVLVLYVVPVMGFVVYKLLGFFGFGAVVYTLILASRARRADRLGNGQSISGGAARPGPGAAPEAAADTTAGAAGPSTAAPSAAAPSQGPTDGRRDDAPDISAAMPRAGFWPRMGALLLDVLLIGFVMSLLHPFGDVHLVILAIYGAVMWKLRGTTVGGIVFDLHVVRLDGRPVDWETAIVRALGCFLSLAVAGLGFIWIAFDDNAQAWHDKIAGTVVVRAKRDRPLV